jgi:hypothetical protein
MRPRIATVRRSSRSVVKPAASAVATLTITSPAAAADASRAVMLTASPSAVKSSTVVPSPVAPTNASPGVDGRSYWDGHRRRGAGSCRSLGEVDCGRYCCCRVARPGDSAEEEPDNLIAHDFVNDAVMGNDRIRCQSIEAVQEGVEVCWAHSFSHGCRAADIGEQQGDRDLHARQLAFAKVGYASCAESWIAGGLPEPRVPEDEATQPGERGCAQLAAWRGRDSFERPPLFG